MKKSLKLALFIIVSGAATVFTYSSINNHIKSPDDLNVTENVLAGWKPNGFFVNNQYMGKAQDIKQQENMITIGGKEFNLINIEKDENVKGQHLVYLIKVRDKKNTNETKVFPFIILDKGNAILQLSNTKELKMGMSYER